MDDASRPYAWVSAALADLDARHLRRSIRDLDLKGVHGRFAGRPVLVFSSNDYLGLSAHPQVISAMSAAASAGSTGSRLLSGSSSELSALERELAGFLDQEAALVFSSGYLAAAGAIPALARGAELVLSDQRNHACLIDGIRLAGLTKRIYQAGSVPEARVGQTVLLVTEAVYGMDGVAAPLEALGDRAIRQGWRTFVDDAHGIGMVGIAGRGHGTAFAKRTHGVVMGTLSKSLGALGGFVAGPRDAIEYLVTTARTFVFDTALPPAVIRAARTALELVPEMERERRWVARLALRLRTRLASSDVPIGGDAAAAPHLLFINIGDAGHALAFGEALLARGIFAPAIRPPTVPDGRSRIRISLTAGHSEDDVDALAAAIEDVRAALLTARH